ncbi:NRAMP family divalent metal transporter [Sulfolobus tengchongensis]|uniref:NRAMP family divalent metal transporter n=1 Tax=Sulfolobus tengchongensis TaxID=207809 RepID=A0AAX4KXG5_9CREN
MSIKEIVKLFGPAWIVMMADVDAASVLTGVANGQEYGYKLIWLLLLLIIPLYVIQEAAGRLGAVNNGKGLGEIIREKFSGKTALLASLSMFVVDLFTYVVEYVGIAVGGLVLGIPPYISLPIFFILHVTVISTKRYEKIEKFLISVSLVMIFAFIVQAILRGIVTNQSIFYISTSKSFTFLVAANIGAVIMPFMIFYQASATSYKYQDSYSSLENKVKWSSAETLIGALVSELLMVAIEMATTGLSPSVDPLNYKEMSYALSLISGPYSPYIFGIGLISSAFLALIVESLGSVWGTLESLGKKDFRSFLSLYLAESIPALIIVLLFTNNYDNVVNFALTLMSISPFVLAIPAILVGILVRDRNIMMDYAYGKGRMVVYWITLVLIIMGGVIAII